MRSKLQQRILTVLEEADHPMFPKEIAVKAAVNHATARSYVRRLLDDGFIVRLTRGQYAINRGGIVADPIHGVAGARLPRVQNLLLSVVDLAVSKSVKRVEVFGDVTLRVTFVKKRDRVSAVFATDIGMDYTSCSFAISRFKAIVKEVLGVEISDLDIWVRNCEFHEDYDNVRMEGVRCLTVETFLGSLAKIYNKKGGLRSEVKVHPDKLEAVFALLRGGATPYYAVQGVFMVQQQLKELTIAMKWNNRELQQLGKLFVEFFKRQGIREQLKEEHQ